VDKECILSTENRLRTRNAGWHNLLGNSKEFSRLSGRSLVSSKLVVTAFSNYKTSDCKTSDCKNSDCKNSDCKISDCKTSDCKTSDCKISECKISDCKTSD